MKKQTLVLGILALTLSAGTMLALSRGTHQPPAAKQVENDEEQEITLDKAPAAVREAALKLAGDATNISKIIREEDDEDIVTYEVEYTDAGVKCASILSVAGDVMETERAIAGDKLPPAALAAIKKDFPGAVLGDAEVITKVAYEVQVTVNGTPRIVLVNAAGSIEDDADKGGQPDKKDADKKEDHEKKATGPGHDGWRADFPIDKNTLVNTGAGDYFVLTPGRKLTYKDGAVTLVVTVLNETAVVDGVTTRVVEEHESKNGEVIEISRNFFALDPKTGDAYYFGEDVDIYEHGKVTKHDGAWRSGVNGASFGLFIPGHPKLGDKFYQEVAPNVALDRFEIVSVADRVETTLGVYEGVVKSEETTPLETGKGYKWFAKGVGMLTDGEIKLVKIENPPSK